MRLEDEIQQKKFKSIQQKLMLNLIYTTNWLTSKQDSLFKDSDITVQQYNVLRILRGQYPNPCSIKLIKERMLDRMSDTSRIVDKLYTKKLLERNECPNDRRSVNVIISDKGLELLKSLDYIDDLSKQSLKSLTTAEINTLNELLDKLRD
ncbi:MAG: MarR family transcriptional regulator [Bacteroidetes bacterium]|nr:MarR family transcriptional regulator [Bacteroidota bacterium]